MLLRILSLNFKHFGSHAVLLYFLRLKLYFDHFRNNANLVCFLSIMIVELFDVCSHATLCNQCDDKFSGRIYKCNNNLNGN